MIRLLALAAATAAVSAATALAAPQPNVKIVPGTPYVDDDITVAFTAPRVLKSANTFDVTIVGKGSCADSVASKTIKPPKKAGQRLKKRFEPTDQVVGSAPEWCRGRAKVSITQARKGKFLRVIATKEFRFRAKP